MTTDSRTSVFVEEQFPLFARGSGQQLVAFIKRYYESQEQANNYIEAVHNLLNYQDIDTAPEEYFDYIAKEIIPSIPERLLTNRELLAKHIREIYRVRGGPLGYRVIFRALFNEEIDLYNPGDDILRASDGRWVEETAIQIRNTVTGDVFDLPGNRIVGEISNASATVDRVETSKNNGILIYTIFLININGEFFLGETVKNIDNSITFNISTSDVGPVVAVELTADGGAFHVIGDTVQITGAESGQNAARGTVLKTRSDSAVDFYVANGGSGFSVNTSINVPSVFGSGIGATFEVTEVGAPYVSRDIYTDFIIYMASVVIGESNTIYTTFIENSANGYLWSANNYVEKEDHGYADGDRVYFFFAAGNTAYTGIEVSDTVANDYYVLNANSSAFQVANTIGEGSVDILNNAQIQVTKASANLALSNVNSTIASSLGTTTSNTGTIVSVNTTDNGYGYYDGTAIGTVDFRQISEQNISDGFGGIEGNNADIQSNYVGGTISTIGVNLSGRSYRSDENVILSNLTRLNTIDAIGIAEASAIIQYEGKYIDTKGWLSWDKYLQDNFYYQEFSYEIRSTQLFTSYESTITDTVHPAGTKMFGAMYLQNDTESMIEEENEIATLDIIVSDNTSPILTFVQNSNTQNDRIEQIGTPYSSVQANDFVYITGATGNTNGTYRISDVLTSNTLLIFDTSIIVKQAPTAEPNTGIDFTTSNITNVIGGFLQANVGDDIFITTATNVNNNGGPFIVINKLSGTEIQVEDYNGNTTPLTASTNDKAAKIEIRKQFTFSANSTSSANVMIYRHKDNYPYSNNTVL